uniref:Uncharacterized protein n=1 Tax=Prymnesium polylepis TaxID=72548 RepID=A0A7S4MLJ3_9EUKA
MVAPVTLLVGAAVAFTAPPTLVQQSQVSARFAPVEMNTKYTVAAGLAKKKNPKTGDSLSLKGYKVGMRAPNTAKSSGTTQGEQSLWDKVFGGGK